jgi:hypothetical protein
MTTQQILEYFNNSTVYKFNGKLSELQEMQEANSNSYNYIIVSDVIYFVAANQVSDSRVSILSGE